MILDTNAVSAIINGDLTIGGLDIAGSTTKLPIVVLGEYLFGLLGSKKRSEYARKLARFETNCEILIADRMTAVNYADIRRRLQRIGRPIPENDLWIAALALQHDLPILSRDAHFDAIESVTRVGW